MRDLTTSEQSLLRSLAEQIVSIFDGLEEEMPVISDEVASLVAAKMEKGECLQCGEIKEERYRCGCCDSCYQKTGRRVRNGEITKKILAEQGLWTFTAQPGRQAKKTKLDEAIANRLREGREASKKAATTTEREAAKKGFVKLVGDIGKEAETNRRKNKKSDRGG